MDTALFIDGENFIAKVEACLIKDGYKKSDIDMHKIQLADLIKKVLPSYNIDKNLFYSAKLQLYEPTRQKSLQLIGNQRALKTNLEKQGFEFVIAGTVRPQMVAVNGKQQVVFKEKGVDVRIAVDMVTFAHVNKLKTAILCSSDSDLLPAIRSLVGLGIEVVYLGFGDQPNKGISFNSTKTVLFRPEEIKDAFPPRITTP